MNLKSLIIQENSRSDKLYLHSHLAEARKHHALASMQYSLFKALIFIILTTWMLNSPIHGAFADKI